MLVIVSDKSRADARNTVDHDRKNAKSVNTDMLTPAALRKINTEINNRSIKR